MRDHTRLSLRQRHPGIPVFQARTPVSFWQVRAAFSADVFADSSQTPFHDGDEQVSSSWLLLHVVAPSDKKALADIMLHKQHFVNNNLIHPVYFL